MTLAAEAKFSFNVDSAIDLLDRRIQNGLDHAAVTLADRIKKSLKVSNNLGLNPSPVGSPPGYGIGDLLKSIHVQTPNVLERRVVASAEQAKLQEFGGIVSTKRKQWLTVPYSDEAKRHKTRGFSSREFPRPLVFIPTRSGEGVLVERKRSGQMVLHYLMRKSVFVPARPFMRPAAHDPTWKRIAAEGFKGLAGAKMAGMSVSSGE